jgi:hypothetical protein
MLLAEGRYYRMSQWFEERKKQREQLRLQTAKIQGDTPALFEALRSAIDEAVGEYRQTYPYSAETLEYIGKRPRVNDRVCFEVLSAPPPADKDVKRKIAVTFDRKTCKVTEDYKGQTFRVGIGRNGDTCFMDGSVEPTIDEVTERIMAPFLFPDLEQSTESAKA